MARGGARQGAGRKLGAVSEQTRLRKEIAAKAASEGVTPLEVMLTAMRNHVAAEKWDAAAAIAKDAAPYVHPRLSAVTMDANVKNDASDLADAELAAVIRKPASGGDGATAETSGKEKPPRVH